MLPAATRYKLLFGPYRTPRCKIGATAKDEIRGMVRIVGLTDACIRWPIGQQGKARGYVVYGRLPELSGANPTRPSCIGGVFPDRGCGRAAGRWG